MVYVATRNGAAVTSLLASLDNDGNPSQGFNPALSGDGRYLAFVTNALNMHNGLDGPTGGCRDGDPINRTRCQIVARDLVRDATRATAGQSRLPGELVSASTKPDCGPPAPSPSETCAGNGRSGNPSLDATGSEIGFDSFADDLLVDITDDNTRDGQGSPAQDAFVRTWRPALSGNDLNFGSVLVGQPTDQTVVITASGFGPISLGDFSITGTNAGDFTLGVTTCVEPTATLHDSSCLISVRFRPAAKGARTGAISVVTGRNSYTRKDPLIIRNLRGVGVTKPVVTPKNPRASTNPTVLDFGSQRPLKVPGKTRSVTVSNPGNGTLNVTGVIVTDSTVPGAHIDYTVNATDCLGGVPPGGSCTITVTFVGHAVGARGAVLVITGNAPGGPRLVELRASVAQPTITANPGIAPTGRVTTVNGKGFAPNQIVAVQFKGTPGTTNIIADNTGEFSVGLVILARGEGGRTITAQSQGVDPSIKGDGPFLVVLGTVNDLVVVNRH